MKTLLEKAMHEEFYCRRKMIEFYHYRKNMEQLISLIFILLLIWAVVAPIIAFIWGTKR